MAFYEHILFQIFSQSGMTTIISKSHDFLNQVDRLEDELVAEQEKFKAINEELEQTFAEMSGY